MAVMMVVVMSVDMVVMMVFHNFVCLNFVLQNYTKKTTCRDNQKW